MAETSKGSSKAKKKLCFPSGVLLAPEIDWLRADAKREGRILKAIFARLDREKAKASAKAEDQG